MAGLKKYIGVYFQPAVAGPKKWRAQIVRRGIVMSLGSFIGPDDAARAYDNAAHHLAEWGDQIPRRNFPDWDCGPALESTLRAERTLKERFPNWEKELGGEAGLTECEKAEKEAFFALDEMARCLTKIKYGYNWAFSMLKANEVEISQLKEQVAKRDRVIEGLKAAGGDVTFKPVTVKPASVENQLS